jgi:hypothetical protein
MPELKEYQRAALETLSDYFRACTQRNDPDTAFYALTRQRFGQGLPYRPVPGMAAAMPYVCVRVPHRRRQDGVSVRRHRARHAGIAARRPVAGAVACPFQRHP